MRRFLIALVEFSYANARPSFFVRHRTALPSVRES